jgi:hypothetical protein
MIRLKPQSSVTRALCTTVPVGNIIVKPDMPTCAVGMEEGQAVLIIGQAFLNANDTVREMMLRHEAHHVFCNHLMRGRSRDQELWNKVCDAAIHYRTKVDPDVLDKAIGGKVVTYERLHIPPCPPEVAYEKLKQNKEQPTGVTGCGLGKYTKYAPGTGADGKPVTAAWVKVVGQIAHGAEIEAEEHGEHPFADASPMDSQSAGDGAGGHGKPIKRLPPPPDWVGTLTHHLAKERGQVLRGRSFRREHRYGNPFLPGRARSRRWDGVFCIDASGSIDDAALKMLLAAVCLTPELRGSTARLFDTKVGDEHRVTDIDAILEDVWNFRGGTRIKSAGEVIGTDRPRVWFTDAYSSDGFPPLVEGDVWVLIGRHFRDRSKVKIVSYPTNEGKEIT